MSSALGVLTAILVAALANTILFPIIALSFERFVGVPITKAAVGVGPRLLAFDLRRTKVEVRLAPLQSYVVPLGANPYEEHAEPDAPWVSWTDASRWRRVLAYVVAPRIAFFAIAVVVLGPRRAGGAFLRGFADFFAAFGGSRGVLERGAAVFVHEGLVVLAALAIAKGTSVAILALPTDLSFACAGRDASGGTRLKTEAKLRAVVMLATVAIFVLWCVAWVRWALA